jgi:predicted ATPase
MGLHTGKPLLTKEGYVGIDVHLASRIGSLGHGGQILLSKVVADLVCYDLPEGVNLLDLGEHRLKGIPQLEPIKQLVISGLASDFPTLKSLNARPNNLPIQPTAFIGRKADLDALDKLISDPETRLVTISGAGGMGKTRLALAVAEAQLFAKQSTEGIDGPRFPDGAFFISLAPLKSTDYLLTSIAEAINFQFYEKLDPKKQLLEYFREKSTLLIMDNFEHLLDGAKLVAEILQVAPKLKVLSTSREKLNLRGEIVYSLSGMEFPTDDLKAAAVSSQIEDEFSAIKLFAERTRHIHPDMEFSQDNMRNVIDICRYLDGMPLGIELAASWIEFLTPREIASEIQESLDFLAANQRDAPERHQSIRAVFDHSWKFVGDEEREAFKKLTIFQGGFTRESAESVTGTSIQALITLVNKSLIRIAHDGRYEIHSLLRQYGEELLRLESEKRDQVYDRHCEFFADFIHHREEAIRVGDQDEVLSEMDNIRAGLRWAVSREKWSEIRKQLLGLHFIFEFQAWIEEAEITFDWLVSVLRSSTSLGNRGIAYGQALSLLGIISMRTGQHEKGIQCLQESHAILHHLNARFELAWACAYRGTFDNSISYNEAIELFQQSLEIFENLGLKWGVALSRMTWGEKANWLERIEEAERQYHEGFRISSELNDIGGLAWYFSGQGRISLLRGDYENAKKHYHESYLLHMEINNTYFAVKFLRILGEIALFLGDFDEAQSYHEEALRIRKTRGDQEGIAFTKSILGYIATNKGEYTTAKELLQDSLESFQQLGDRISIGYVLCYLGNLAVRIGDPREAQVKYYSALGIVADSEDTRLCLFVLLGVAEWYKLAGNYERAVELASLVQNIPQPSRISVLFSKEAAKRVLSKLATKLTPEQFVEAHEQGIKMQLLNTVEELISELKSVH